MAPLASRSDGGRHAAITADNHSALLSVVGWAMLALTVLAPIGQIWVRYWNKRKFCLSDFHVVVGTGCGLSCLIVIGLAGLDGLGNRSSLKNETRREKILKDVYASTLLYIVAVGLTKLPLLKISRIFDPGKRYFLPNRILTYTSMLWIVAGFLVEAFHCPLPRPWLSSPGKCASTDVMWYILGPIDMLLDFAIVGLAFLVQLQRANSKRRAFTSSIRQSFRILAPGAQIARLIFMHRLRSAPDQSFGAVNYFLATEVQVVIVSVASTVTYIQPYLNSARSQMLSICLSLGSGTFKFFGPYGPHESLPKGSARHGRSTRIRLWNMSSRRERRNNLGLPSRPVCLHVPPPGYHHLNTARPTFDCRRRRNINETYWLNGEDYPFPSTKITYGLPTWDGSKVESQRPIERRWSFDMDVIRRPEPAAQGSGTVWTDSFLEFHGSWWDDLTQTLREALSSADELFIVRYGVDSFPPATRDWFQRRRSVGEFDKAESFKKRR